MPLPPATGPLQMLHRPPRPVVTAVLTASDVDQVAEIASQWPARYARRLADRHPGARPPACGAAARAIWLNRRPGFAELSAGRRLVLIRADVPTVAGFAPR